MAHPNESPDPSAAVAMAAVEAFAHGKTALAYGVARRCTDIERARRMRRAAELFAGQLGLESPDQAVQELQRRSLGWGSIERRLLLVDLWSVQPFSPYDIKVEKADQRAALNELATALDARGAVAEIDRCAREIRNSTRFKSALKVGGAVAAGSVVMAGTGFVAAPFIGAALGASMGLSGAAATSAGLAALGGGSLAAGGAGVAGGMAVVATAGAALGGVVGGGGTAMYQLGSRQAQIELRKMELKFKVALLQTQAELRVAQRFATHLHDEVTQIRTDLETERRYSERRSKRISSLEKLLEQFEQSEAWMNEQLDAAR